MIYQGETLSVSYLEEGIAQLQFVAKGAVNVLDKATLLALEEAIGALKQQTALQGVILCSNKPSFIVGADISEFLSLFALENEALDQWLAKAHTIFNALEDLHVPTLSVIQGHVLGGGCELILATDLRIADDSAKIALPETKLGIMPGFGGTVRLPRLIGADNAIEWICTGQEYSPEQAAKFGLIDAQVPSEQLIPSALRMIKAARAGKLDWQARRQQKKAPLRLPTSEAQIAFATAAAMVYAKVGPHYPAPLCALKTIQDAAHCSRDEALTIERAQFIPLAKGPVAHSLIRVFLNEQYVKGLAKKASQFAAAPTAVAVLGAGIMGAGIAYQSARKGIHCHLKDITQIALDVGMEHAYTLLNKEREKGLLDSTRMTKILSHITPTLQAPALQRAEVVVEAVVEDPRIKSQVLAQTEALLQEDAILVSNTSTICIDKLAHLLQRPAQFCGMHFFNPVHRMPLVEVVRGQQSSAHTIAQIVAYASAIGKTAIVVNDCPGFFVNRVLFPYFFAFNQLLMDGVDFVQIDQVMAHQFGWPMGPAQLLDVVGIDTAYHASQMMAKGYPNRMGMPSLNAIALLYQAKRLGQKSGRGFYHYVRDHKGNSHKQIDPAITALLQPITPTSSAMATQTIIERMMIPMINEVLLCLEEGIIASPAEADLALVYGLGFPPFRAGICHYLDSIGLANYLTLCESYRSLGPLYQPSEQIKQRVVNQQHFYRCTQSGAHHA